MRQNKYDNPNFYSAYEQMPRSVKGLKGAGEWHIFRELMPDLRNKNVVDLGCGFGWHCRYAREQGARSVVGVDISENMINKAREITNDSFISYIKKPIEDFAFTKSHFDFIMSSLAFHYIESFKLICEKVYDSLKVDGTFVFSVEHPNVPRSEEHTSELQSRGHLVCRLLL